MERDDLHTLIREVEALPYHKFLGLKVSRWDQGSCEIQLSVSDNARNIYGAVHGGVYYTICDVAAFIATCTLIPNDVIPVTTDISVSIISNISEGNLWVLSNTIKVGKKVGFIESRVLTQDNKLIAVARITKSMMSKRK